MKIYFPYVKTILRSNYILSRARRDEIGKLASDPGIWTMNQEELKNLQFKAIKQSFNYHYENCEFYRRYVGEKPESKPMKIS